MPGEWTTRWTLEAGIKCELPFCSKTEDETNLGWLLLVGEDATARSDGTGLRSKLGLETIAARLMVLKVSTVEKDNSFDRYILSNTRLFEARHPTVWDKLFIMAPREGVC